MPESNAERPPIHTADCTSGRPSRAVQRYAFRPRMRRSCREGLGDRACEASPRAGCRRRPGAESLAADPGVSSTRSSSAARRRSPVPESAYAVVAQGAKAYFDYVNANGGVFGRDIRYVYLDDAYDPAQTVQQTRRLVEQERVFAIFNVVGTEHTLATRPYLNQLGIPQLFVGSGTALVREAGTRGRWATCRASSPRGRLYGRHIAKTRPKATIAVLYEDSDFGSDLLEGCGTAYEERGRSLRRRATR